MFLYSKKGIAYHDKERVTERCNTDQLTNRQESDIAPRGKKPCTYCIMSRWEKAKNNVDG